MNGNESYCSPTKSRRFNGIQITNNLALIRVTHSAYKSCLRAPSFLPLLALVLCIQPIQCPHSPSHCVPAAASPFPFVPSTPELHCGDKQLGLDLRPQHLAAAQVCTHHHRTPLALCLLCARTRDEVEDELILFLALILYRICLEMFFWFKRRKKAV